MDNLEEYERRLAELEARMAQVSELMAGWPTPATLLQGFLAGRFQRRDGHGYQQPIENIPEAPADNVYYGRYNYTWAPVVSEVPIGAAAYARARSEDGTVGWGNIAALGFLSLAGGQMSGPLITRDGGSATNPGLAVGENSTGFYRTSGNLLVTTVSGVIVMQIQTAIAAIFVQLDLSAHRISNIGDAIADTDALNRRTADARYAPVGSGGDFLPISGGTMTGSLIAKPGSGINDLGIGVGDNTTGFYRQGGSLTIMALGYPLMLLDGNARSILLTGPLSAGGNPITNVGIAVLPGDAASKNYVDVAIANARAPTVLYDLPADVPIAGDGEWHLLAQVPFALARTGMSRIQITLNCNLSGVNNVASIGARLIDDAVERTIFGFGISPGDSVGFNCNLYFDSNPGLINIPVELTSLALQASPSPFTVLGGSGPRRSQIVITDLGPA
jgi:hypothetical protein